MDHVNYNFRPKHYDALSSYEWINDYLKCLEIKDEIKFLKSKISETNRTQAAKKSMVERYKASWEAYEKRRIVYLAKILGQSNGSARDPFSMLINRTSHDPQLKRVCIKLDWDDVKKALDLLFAGENGETLTDAEREKRLADLEQAIEELEAQLKEYSPAGYFKLNNGKVVEDFRETFTRNWRTLQYECNSPVNPHGGPLNDSPDIEQQAYQQLEISRAINPKGLDPNPNY